MIRTDSLKGRTALVTGAARRIGREISLALAKEGVNIIAHYFRSTDQAEELRRELTMRDIKAWLIAADFENADEIQQLFRKVQDMAGSVDILVNSASIFLPDTIGDMDFSGLMRQMQVNAWAPFTLCREFARSVDHGKIVNLLDSRIVGYDRSHTTYSLSKRTFAAMTKMMAMEFAPGITVNGVAPGLILPPPGKDQRHLDDLAETVPLKRHGDAGDIADAVIFLLASKFVTGQVVFVDGGSHLME
jgi:pteridine reductase